MKKSPLTLLTILSTVFLFACFGEDQSQIVDNNEVTTPVDEVNFRETGKAYADSAQKLLGKNLKKALSEGDAISALHFCSTRAISLTDSAANDMSVRLKRISDKPRNPINTADINQLRIIGEMKNQKVLGQEIEPKMVRDGDLITGYYPIVIQPLCLQCHGILEREIRPETAAVIAQLYPVDKAVGYQVGDVRGAWEVEMRSN